MTVNFTGGMLKVGNQYINPDHIVAVKGNMSYNNYDEKYKGDNAIFTHIVLDTETTDINRNRAFTCSPDKFVEKMMEAKQTGQVIDLEA